MAPHLRTLVPLATGLALTLPLGLVACSDDAPYGDDGVADVRKACDLRATWSRKSQATCLECVANAPTIDCGCPVQSEFAGRCAEQSALRNAEPQCDDALVRCLGACADCQCQDACYTQKDACRKKASAVDGCVTATCERVCR